MLDGCKVRTCKNGTVTVPYGTVWYWYGTIEVDFIFHESAFTYVRTVRSSKLIPQFKTYQIAA